MGRLFEVDQFITHARHGFFNQIQQPQATLQNARVECKNADANCLTKKKWASAHPFYDLANFGRHPRRNSR
jgi:hypothetical protein